MGNHRVKRCEKTIDVSEDVREFVEEIIMGDSSGDEKIDPEDLDPDERLGLDLKLLTSGRLSELIYPLNPGCKNPKKR